MQMVNEEVIVFFGTEINGSCLAHHARILAFIYVGSSPCSQERCYLPMCTFKTLWAQGMGVESFLRAFLQKPPSRTYKTFSIQKSLKEQIRSLHQTNATEIKSNSQLWKQALCLTYQSLLLFKQRHLDGENAWIQAMLPAGHLRQLSITNSMPTLECY